MGQRVDRLDDVRRRPALSEVLQVVTVSAGVLDDVVKDRDDAMDVIHEGVREQGGGGVEAEQGARYADQRRP
jgi:hypothetical protein